VRRSKIAQAIDAVPQTCSIRFVDILSQPPFTPREFIVHPGKEEAFWSELHQDRPEDSRLRAVFLDRPSGPVLKMIGTKLVLPNEHHTFHLNLSV
jgi:hypothetical protein